MSDEELLPAAPDPQWAATWAELGQGAPTLAALARVASLAMAAGPNPSASLSPEARCFLFAAKDRGILEVKGSNREFDAPGRMLAVYVEADGERTLLFRNRSNPSVAIRFLAGFRELCAAGLVMHHIYTEFSLTRKGLDVAQTVPSEEVSGLMDLASELGAME